MIMIKNQMRTIPTILIHQPDADAEEPIISRKIRQIHQKVDQDGNDAIVNKIMIHWLPRAEDEAIAAKNLIAILLLNHLVHDAAAAKNQVR